MIPFNVEEFRTGKYFAVSRDGYPLWFVCNNQSTFLTRAMGTDDGFEAVFGNAISSFRKDGTCPDNGCGSNMNDLLYLVPHNGDVPTTGDKRLTHAVKFRMGLDMTQK